MPIPTKLFMPPLRENVLSRSRLNDIVQNSLSGKLTLISAPAGFGKTTLLCECTEQINRPVAWISLDKDDNDKYRFLNYFISGLGLISEGFGESILTAHQSSSEEIVLAGLINEIIEISNPFILILDDYHVITNPKIHEFLENIIENQPPEMHLIISTRSEPPWALARWRVRQEMTEIRSRDLCFSLEETTTYLNDVMQLGLSEEAVSKLETKTEGWIAGLLMAAISLQDREDVDNFIQAFEGTHRYIFDYLVEEVLDQLSSEYRDFLIRTSILDRLCAPLCNSLLNIPNSQSILHRLDSMNLFIIPLDDQRYWYRYHHLFLDLLSSRQVELNTKEVKKLHLQASIWYENNGYLIDAIDHAVKSGRIESAAQLVETNVLGILDRGEMWVLIQLLNQLPEKSLAEYPWLHITLAWALTQTGYFDEALSCLVSIEDSLLAPSKEQTQHIAGHIAAMRSYIEMFSYGDHTQVVNFAEKALEFLPDSDLRTRGMAYVLLSTIQRVRHNLSPALDTLQSALDIYQTRNQPYVVIDILSQMARVRREQGFLHEAVRLCQEAINLSIQNTKKGDIHFPNITYTMGVLGRIHYEWNQLDKAIKLGLQGLAIAERWGQKNSLLGHYLFLARIYRAQRRFQDALDAIQIAKSIGGQSSGTREFIVRTHEMQIRLAMGDFDPVEKWVSAGYLDLEKLQDEGLWELAPLIIPLYQNNRVHSLDELTVALDRLHSASIRKGLQRKSIKIEIQKAIILYVLNKHDHATASIKSALNNGKEEGFVRSFIDHGKIMEAILKLAIRSGVEVDYANELLSISQVDSQEETIQSEILESSIYVETLTNRETEVLRLLSTELSVSEISNELVVTVGTLRTHIKRIYSKLDVHSRFEAVSKAKEHNLLS